MNEKHRHPGPGAEEARPGPGGDTRPGSERIERRSLSEAANAYVEAVAAGAGATTGALLVTGACRRSGKSSPRSPIRRRKTSRGPSWFGAQTRARSLGHPCPE